MTRRCCLSWLVLAALVCLVPPASADSFLVYSEGGFPPGNVFTWCDTPPCKNDTFINCDNPEGAGSFRTIADVWGGFGSFLLQDLDLGNFLTGELRFWVRAPDAVMNPGYSLKIEFSCKPDPVLFPAGVTYTTTIDQHGWDGTEAWQEIRIPLLDSSFNQPVARPIDLACLQAVDKPFLATIADLPVQNGFLIDYVRYYKPSVNPGASTVTTDGRQLLVDGEPFVVNAFDYAPLSVGENWTGAWNDRPDRYLVDFPLMAANGANAVRLYAPVLSKAMLDAAWANGLFVIPTFGVNTSQLMCPEGRQFQLDRFREDVEEWKDHPALLAWLVGNETNANLFGADLCTEWYTQLDALALEAQNAGSAHPVGTAVQDSDGVLGDVCQSGCSDDTALPNVDFWGLQLYRGCSFGTAFNQYAAKADCDRPMIVTEFGADAWISDSYCDVSTSIPCYITRDCPAGTCSTTTTTACHYKEDCPVGTCSTTTTTPCHADEECPIGQCSTSAAPCRTDDECPGAQTCVDGETCVGGEICNGADSCDFAGAESQIAQANCLQTLLTEADQNLAVRGGVSSGHAIFEWLDEWWKSDAICGTGWENHDGCATFTNFNYPDPAINEEYWGVVSQTDTNPDTRNARTVATNIGNSWNLGNVCDMKVASYDKPSGDTDITYIPAPGSSDHTLYYGPLNQVSAHDYSAKIEALGADGDTSFTLPAGSWFWVVVGRNNTEEGGYGVGLGERPQSTAASVPQDPNRTDQCGTP